MYRDVDELGDAVYQRGIRAVLSDNIKDAYVDVVSQNIVLQEKAADHYLTSVLSSVYRLPPFDFTPVDGYSFLNVRHAGNVMFYPELGLYVISLATMLTQMVFLVGNQDETSHLNEILTKVLVKSVDLKPKLFDQILFPSFKIDQVNQEY